MLDEIEFRAYRPGDESGIVDVMRACFETYRHYGLTPLLWLDYERLAPGFSKETAFVAAHRGRVVGHVQLVVREVRLAPGVCVKTGGIANVSTHPEYRGRGIATRLMKMALDYCRRRRIPMSSLFTGYGSAAHRIYRRLGYADTVFSAHYMAEAEEAERALARLPSPPSLVIRDFEEGDEKGMLAVYERQAAAFSGWPPRTLEQWRRRLVLRVAAHSFFYEPRSPATIILVAEGDGRIRGYAYALLGPRLLRPTYPGLSESGVILEVVGEGRAVVGALVRAVIERLLEGGVKRLEAWIPPCPPYDSLLSDFVLIREAGVYMDAVLDLPLLLSGLCGAMSRLLEESGLRPRLSVRIESEGQAATMRFDGYEVSIGDGHADAHLRFTKHGLARLLYGVRSLEELIAAGHADILHCSGVPTRGLLELFAAIFPRKCWLIWPADHW